MSRSSISSIPLEQLNSIQYGTMSYEWKGVPCLKNPFDLALYQMLLWRRKPRTLIEIGSNKGGSALWFADMAEILRIDMRIISIDIVLATGVEHPRIEFRKGDGRKLGETLSPQELASLPRPLLVIEDGSHDYDQSLASLRFFDPIMKSGEYLVIEDGIIESMQAAERYNGGPSKALDEFLAEAGERYEVDASYCDYFGYNATWNTNGYLRRR
ncbi:MAG TPA: CmcI family methyltransferase [Hyphomonadaceae bacterium]|nr:CmcI family methyltransferase [Hyphomonadaceae bacterium]